MGGKPKVAPIDTERRNQEGFGCTCQDIGVCVAVSRHGAIRACLTSVHSVPCPLVKNIMLELPGHQQLWRRDEERDGHSVELEEGHEGHLVGNNDRSRVRGQVGILVGLHLNTRTQIQTRD